ncbi:MAG: ABC transporter permease [Armatimonadota bacterium]|nr:ABC transporter permease [Armatimonadota bacterium]MDR7426342.1 ABC transporter permease [Armatimonadota bacterium]MDR7464948.1 ABC transporter permease [Armatimonadota bacterium]MDR7469174.1 ABC transporter permease [Armatimonadota bacterium]MDR7474555.1 ABC transporter permease [Armatimonadota bacterium]
MLALGVTVPRARWAQHRALRTFLRNRAAKAGLAILILLGLAAAFAGAISPHPPLAADLNRMLQPPSRAHPLGTDELGRDLLSRVLYGARISLTLGFVSVSIGLLAGTALGALGTYRGGWVDLLCMRFVDVLLSFPPVLLAICIVAVMGPSLYNAMIAIGIAQMPVYARLVRGLVLAIREQQYVEAARALGAHDSRILLRHILPNCLSPLIVQSTLQVASAILSAAALGFLGLGAQPPTPEWGAMLSKGRLYLRVAPHLTAFPGLAIFVTVLGFNLFGDGLRDALDPRMAARLGL